MYIVIKKYKTSKEDLEKYNLVCKERYVKYDYINKIFVDSGIPADYTTFDKILKSNKHRFTRKTLPLF